MTVGVDMVFVPGLRQQLADPASTFASRVFTRAELKAAELKALARATHPATPPDPSPHLAARWAAKEAFLKAWDLTRWGEAPLVEAHEVDHREIEVVTDAWGRPALRLHGHIAALLGAPTCSLSLSHDGDYAIAVVSLELARTTQPEVTP